MSYFVYIIGSLKNSKPKTYVGWTKDLNERLRKHNSGKGAKSTQITLLYIIIWDPSINQRKIIKRQKIISKSQLI